MSEHFSSIPIRSESKKSRLAKVKRIIAFLFPVALLFFSVWLIFVKFQRSPMEEIEYLLKQKEYSQALDIVEQYLEKDSLNRLRLLMYGSIIEYAYFDNGVPLVQPAGSYEERLKKEDTAFIFLKESYLRRMELFPASPRFLQLTCDFFTLFPAAYLSPQVQLLFTNGLETDSVWLPADKNCLGIVFDEAIPFFRQRLSLVGASGLNFRQYPIMESEVIDRLSTGEEILLRKKGPYFEFGGRKGNWQYIFTSSQKQGWVFDAYLKPYENLP